MARNSKSSTPERSDNNNDVVISFHDTLLHKSDVDLLTGPHWLNDNLISFYFEYLEKVTYRENRQLLFIGPQVTQCLKMSNWQDVGVFLDPLGFNQRDFVFFALNDCDLLEIPGGTHWSLLVLSKPENIFCHLDSCTGTNADHAWKLGTNISRYMHREVDFTEMSCLQQTNTYDCGIHVLCNVDHFATFCAEEYKILDAGWVRRPAIQAKRTEVLDLISSVKEASL